MGLQESDMTQQLKHHQDIKTLIKEYLGDYLLYLETYLYKVLAVFII